MRIEFTKTREASAGCVNTERFSGPIAPKRSREKSASRLVAKHRFDGCRLFSAVLSQHNSLSLQSVLVLPINSTSSASVISPLLQMIWWILAWVLWPIPLNSNPALISLYSWNTTSYGSMPSGFLLAFICSCYRLKEVQGLSFQDRIPEKPRHPALIMRQKVE